jgi:hypothetical protein
LDFSAVGAFHFFRLLKRPETLFLLQVMKKKPLKVEKVEVTPVSSVQASGTVLAEPSSGEGPRQAGQVRSTERARGKRIRKAEESS